MTWTPKPLGEIWNHPIFTLSGFAVYWNDLARTFWRGEFVWHHVALAAWPVDALLVLLSTIFLAAFFVADVAGIAKRRPESRLAAVICFLLFVSAVALLILGSVWFDFGRCHYPSPAWPYLSSGRLLLGVMVPFLIMFLRGLEALLGWLRLSSARPFVLAAIVSVLVVSQIALSLPVFASQYNWYHP